MSATLLDDAPEIVVSLRHASAPPSFQRVPPPDYDSMDVLTRSIHRTDTPGVCRIDGILFTVPMLRRRLEYGYAMPVGALALLGE